MSDWLDAEEKVWLPAVIQLPDDYPSRLALVEACWERLTPKQKTFLAAWRDCRFNQNAACRQIGLSEKSRPMTGWMQEPDYATVVRVWRANAAADALDKDRLLARQDDIVESLMTPKPVLHQGLPVLHEGKILEEIEAGAASRANEVLLQAAGVVKSGKDAEVNVNVGIVGPALNIQVMPLSPSKNVAHEGVKVELPAIDAEFSEVADDWL